MAKYLARRRGTPPSHTWRAFLSNHVAQLASVDFFTVPTATFRVLSVFVVLAHDKCAEVDRISQAARCKLQS